MTQTGPLRGNRRIIFDITSVSTWLGPPVGIIRREQALARHALSKRPDIRFSVFDKRSSSFVAIDPAWVERLIASDYALDAPSPAIRHSRAGPGKLKSPRDLLTAALERRRLATNRPKIRHAIDLAQRLLRLPRRLTPPFADERGSRFGTAPMDLAVCPPLTLGPEDVIVSVGSDWNHKDAPAISQLKRRFGFRYVVMCHDLIPVMHPEFFPDGFAAQFQRHWLAIFPIADRVLVNSRKVEADIRDYCRKAGIEVREIVLVQPGCDLTSADPAAPLPQGLEPGKFALFVATIEPRKGHAMLMDVWRKLLAEGTPQRRGFKLVFVGRPGWNVENVLREIADGASFQGTLMHLSDVGDATLAALYRGAAFCLLPSIYEGFGVPIVEAFAHGKPVIASTGGALLETVGSLSPCFPATDAQAWLAAIRRWIEDDDARLSYEAKIRASFAHPGWDQAAAKIFEAAQADG